MNISNISKQNLLGIKLNKLVKLHTSMFYGYEEIDNKHYSKYEDYNSDLHMVELMQWEDEIAKIEEKMLNLSKMLPNSNIFDKLKKYFGTRITFKS